MSTPSTNQPQLGSVSRGTAISISSEIMVAAIIFFFVVVVFVFFLHIYARMRWGRMASASRRSRLVFAASQDPPAVSRCGLDLSVINSLPVCVYRDEDFKAAGGLECAVCLSELNEGEKARILPKCNHGFHLDCIDMWFHSHSTCPLCRRPVGPDGDLEAGTGGEATPPPEEDLAADLTGSPNLPTNVLFWGTQDQVSTVASQEAAPAPVAASVPSSSSPRKLDGALVIEIPERAPVEFSSSSPHSPLPTSKFPMEDMKSPATATTTPTSTRLRALRRILSREKRVAGPSSSFRGAGDIEQGMGGTNGGCSGGVVPRTPTGSGKN
ncbi:hypothetical protein Taro_028634 [Colocasia esculenta]|uniref:RING-type E3 ubiquitin transferase n=1 Tax=Colocasia esculenta TaxID=4460 RepID=A0A843VBS0_COLES|nr:hypothetical protein [Colocasia esculenta]